MAAGDAFLSYQKPAEAEEFYTLALAKPGVDTPRVLTRLGIAQADQGKSAEAQATFAKVEGRPAGDRAAVGASMPEQAGKARRHDRAAASNRSGANRGADPAGFAPFCRVSAGA